ncbi:MAG: PKD domain-containing protein [Litorimonas sp.]
MNNILKSTLIICALPLLALPANAAEIDPDSIEIGAEVQSYPFGDFCFAKITFEARADTDDDEYGYGRDNFFFAIDDPEGIVGSGVSFDVNRYDAFTTFEYRLPVYHVGPYTLQFFDVVVSYSRERDDPISEAIEIPRDVLLAAGGICAERANYASNEKPTAAAGLDQAIRAGDTVSLDGSASFDDNTGSVDLGYNWSFSNQPVGSTAILTDAMTATPSFTADLAGTYDIALIVTDEGGLDSDADNVSVSSDNLAPTADAGDGQLVVLGSNVYLDGSGSNDPENDPLTYGWALTAPAGSTAALSDPASATPVFSTDVEGTYSVQLTVSDFLGAGTPDTTEIVAASNGDYALSKIMDANAYVLGLSDAEFTKKGNRKAFGKLLRKAVSEIQKGKTSSAIKKLEKAIERTDGCALNGTPDTDKKRDWITNCAAQDVVYACLTDALDALNSDAAGTGQGKPKKEKKAKKPKKAKKVKN